MESEDKLKQEVKNCGIMIIRNKQQTAENTLFTFKNNVLFNTRGMSHMKPVCTCDFQLTYIDVYVSWHLHVRLHASPGKDC